MTELVHQIGELFLRAVPVALIVLVFFAVMRTLFFQPLLRVMAERDSRTLGAQKAAEAAQAAAAQKIKEYENALKEARAKVYAEQDATRKKMLQERAIFLKEMRRKAEADVAMGKERVAQELETAKKEIGATIGTLAAEIARRVLQSAAPRNPSEGAR
jgi:F-type H+-transporting ATPase subunit b